MLVSIPRHVNVRGVEELLLRCAFDARFLLTDVSKPDMVEVKRLVEPMRRCEQGDRRRIHGDGHI